MGKSTTQRKFSFFGSSSLWRSLYLCAALRRSWPQACSTVSSGRWPFGSPPHVASTSRSSGGGAHALADGGHLRGIVAVQALQVVENAQPALVAERLQLVALLAAELQLRNVNGLERQAGGGEVRQQVFHAVHRRNARIGLVAAVAAHGLGVGEAREARLNAGSRPLRRCAGPSAPRPRRCAPAAGRTSPGRSG